MRNGAVALLTIVVAALLLTSTDARNSSKKRDPDKKKDKPSKTQKVKEKLGLVDNFRRTVADDGTGLTPEQKARKFFSIDDLRDLPRGHHRWNLGWTSASRTRMFIKSGSHLSMLDTMGFNAYEYPSGYAPPSNVKLAHKLDADGKRVNIPVHARCRGGLFRIGDRTSRCLVDLRDPVYTRNADFARRTYIPGQDENKYVPEEVCTYPPSKKYCLANMRAKSWMEEELNPVWEDPAHVDIKGLGVNGVQCELFVTVKTTTESRAQWEDVFTDKKERLRRIQLGVFRVTPYIMRTAQRDADGFVTVPVYAHTYMKGRFKSSLKRAGVPFNGNAIRWIMGDQNGSAKVKLELLDVNTRMLVSNSDTAPQPNYVSTKIRPYDRWLNHGNCPMVFAHRGIAAADQIENTPASIVSTASQVGVDGIEIDVYLTPALVANREKAGKLRSLTQHKKPNLKRKGFTPNEFEARIFHDPSFERLFDLDAHQTGSIMTWLQPRAIQAIREEIHCGDVMPSLKRVLLELKQRAPDTLLDIELKPGSPLSDPYKPYAKWMGKVVGNTIRSVGMEDHVIVSAFDHYKLEYINKGRPQGAKKIRVAVATYKTFASKVLNFFNWLSRKVIPSARVLHHSLISKKLVDKYHKKGLPVGTYTIYDLTENPKDKSHSFGEIERLVKSGVDWIETDDPATLKDDLTMICQRLGLVGRGNRPSESNEA